MNKDIEWTITDAMMGKIFELVPAGGTILELGSGYSTYAFDQCGYKVITVEHDPQYLNKVPNATYIYAPIELYDNKYQQLNSIKKRIDYHVGWYDREVLAKSLPSLCYDCIVVDGPPSHYGRSGFYANLDLFHCAAIPIVFDDCHRIDDLYIAQRVARHLGRNLTIFNPGIEKKSFGVALP
jgi:hypothetical protein